LFFPKKKTGGKGTPPEKGISGKQCHKEEQIFKHHWGTIFQRKAQRKAISERRAENSMKNTYPREKKNRKKS